MPFILWVKPEEWQNSIVIPTYMKGGKQKVENYSWKVIVYLMRFIKYDKVFNEKLKGQAKQFLLVCRNGF